MSDIVNETVYSFPNSKSLFSEDDWGECQHCLNSMAQWALNLITLLISLLSCPGQQFHNCQKMNNNSNSPFLVYLVFVYVSKENYFIHNCFFQWPALSSRQSQSKADFIRESQRRAQRGLLGSGLRKLGAIQNLGVACMPEFFFSRGVHSLIVKSKWCVWELLTIIQTFALLRVISVIN